MSEINTPERPSQPDEQFVPSSPAIGVADSSTAPLDEIQPEVGVVEKPTTSSRAPKSVKSKAAAYKGKLKEPNSYDMLFDASMAPVDEEEEKEKNKSTSFDVLFDASLAPTNEEEEKEKNKPTSFDTLFDPSQDPSAYMKSDSNELGAFDTLFDVNESSVNTRQGQSVRTEEPLQEPADVEHSNGQNVNAQDDISMQEENLKEVNEATFEGEIPAGVTEENGHETASSVEVPQSATSVKQSELPQQGVDSSSAAEYMGAATMPQDGPALLDEAPQASSAAPAAAPEDGPILATVPIPAPPSQHIEQVLSSSNADLQTVALATQEFSADNVLASMPANFAAESSASGARRPSPSRVSIEAQEKARQEEALQLQKENEDMRLMWLSLPANDHLTYYSDTEDEASSSANEGNGLAPKGAYGGMPLLSRTKYGYGNGKRKRQDWLEDERESSDSDDENLDSQDKSDERRYRTGNRGNKLLKGSRWNRRGKLGLWTEAKNEKEMHDRFMSRVKAIQRAGVESLLFNAPGPKAVQSDGPVPRDILEGSDRLLFRDINSTSIVEENLQSTSLAPALLRPILSARALLESHTLRHTFRNPHIGALSKTALDLRESEGHLSRALGRCFSAMEKMSAYIIDAETGEVRVNGSQNTDNEMDLTAIGAEGTAGTADEVNPALIQLDDLFVTKKGLPIPVASSEGEEQIQQSTETQAILTTHQQRDVIRAALECLQDLGLDSLEYVERLDEVRGRLEGVKRRRTQVWEALRLWALKREGGEEDDENEVDVEEEEIINTRPIGKSTVAATSNGPRRKR